ncbi:unnamed protein product [Dovyalis caffra]|uniref:Cationic amino acid transporter C-terminal domain-containing protein n=1 Tax=Dovyalis caffra TaxID=77055 RepID=A0AAV1RYB8_9ROSI|nr:unnamed protein product [Dovyalis caffra]
MQNNEDGDGNGNGGFNFRSCVFRRKQVDSVLVTRHRGSQGQQLAKILSVVDIIAIGVGATIGAGVYILVGTVAREQTGPALAVSFLIAGIAAALSAFCYAELVCRCPSAGSAYHYTYICIGEGAAWLVGWALILEYTIGGSAIARGLTPNLALLFGGEDNLPSYLSRHTILGIVVDPCAAVLILIVTVLLCIGIKEPRMFMAMARDGLLPSFFSDINERTQVPVKSTVTIGILAAALAFFMDVSQLAGMVSVGTLLAFTSVAVSVLILRYVPPDEVPLHSSFQHHTGSLSQQFSSDIQEVAYQNPKGSLSNCDRSQHLLDNEGTSIGCTLLQKHMAQGFDESDEQTQQKRRKIAAWNIALVCIGVLVLASAASVENIPSLIVLACLAQDSARHSFGHSGGFVCPFVPFLPVACILVNAYLLVNLGAGTWFRVSIWLLVGALVYLFYGRTHSSLMNAVYVPTAYADEIYRTSSDRLV